MWINRQMRMIDGCRRLANRLAVRIAFCAALALSPAIPLAAQYWQPTLSVNGTPVVSSRPMTRVGNEWFVPLVSLARTMGSELKISSQRDSFSLVRSDGAHIFYDAHTGEIRQGAIIIGHVSEFRKVEILGGADELMFPLQGVVALLGAEIQEDHEANTLNIATATIGSKNGDGAGFNLADAQYSYGYTSDGNTSSQFTMLRGDAVMGMKHSTWNLLLNRFPNGVYKMTQGTVRTTFLSGRALTLGDQLNLTGLDAIATPVRGVGYDQNIGEYSVQVSGGRALSATRATVGLSDTSFDTTYLGFAVHRKRNRREWTFGGNYFNGTNRNGASIGIGYSLFGKKHHLNMQAFGGSFRGISSRTLVNTQLLQTDSFGNPLPGADPSIQTSAIRVDGMGVGFLISDVYTPTEKWTISSQYSRFSGNFLTAREDARYNGQASLSLSTNYQLNTHVGLNASIGNRSYTIGPANTTRLFGFGANASIPARIPMQVGYFRTIQQTPDNAFPTNSTDQISFTIPRWKRYALFTFWSFNGGSGMRSSSLSTNLSADFGQAGQFQFHHVRQSSSDNQIIGLDWQWQIPKNRGFVHLGEERITGRNAAYQPVVGLNLGLPWKQSVDVRYLRTRGNSLLQITLNGPMIRRRELVQRNGLAPAVVLPTQVTGQIYEDINNDGSFEGNIDRPISNLRVQLEDGSTAMTDSRGTFRFYPVIAGAHTIKANIGEVPADLAMMDGALRTISAVPRRANAVNYRLLKTGRIMGNVLFGDVGSESMNNHPALDVRIFVSREKDALSEANGNFLIGDIAPGKYDVKIDPDSIPAGLIASPASISLVLKPGETLKDIQFKLIPKPPVVIERELPAQMVDVAPRNDDNSKGMTRTTGGTDRRGGER